MKIKYESAFHKIADEHAIVPDKYTLLNDVFTSPKKSFVLCKDRSGLPTAVYGARTWDFAPINMAETTTSKLHFSYLDSLNVTEGTATSLYEQTKQLMFMLIYFSGSGRTGISSVKVIVNRFHCLRKISLFCVKCNNELIADTLSIKDILSSESYLAAHVKELTEHEQSELSNLLSSLRSIKAKYLGVEIVKFHKPKPDTKQTPVIPSRIYFSSFEKLQESVKKYHRVRNHLTELIKEFKRENVGLALSTQNKEKLTNQLPTLPELLKKHRLYTFFTENYSVKDKKNLTPAIRDIQLTCKTLIHQYTAMRNGEALRIKYDCINSVNLSDEKDVAPNLKPNRFVQVISTTTKFTAYKHEAGWLCPKDVIYAIETLQAIVDGLAVLFNIEPKELPLFHSPAIITHTGSKQGTISSFNGETPSCLSDLQINQNDRDELINSDNTRKYDHPKFDVGANWPFTSHQFRRSLAFYGANSNLISESTGAQLFKHLNHEMQRYYRKGFNNIRTVLGYLDKTTGEIKIPDDHFIFEFQTGMSTNQARQILELILEDNQRNGGKKGDFIAQHRSEQGIQDDDVYILELKSETQRKVDAGEISYKKTLLGGCLKVGRCNSFMLGEFTACLSCNEANIELDKVDAQILKMENKLITYDNGSAEHQLVSRELSELKTFKEKALRKAELA
ncbi:hypothetical protein CWB76_01900 [Pseudoalteromonas sp. S1609]|uniref:hypothetical protein n=1 Tax=Pseudoalteromonas sp. S1609 TaxID=579505 RepID=UPI00110AEAB8|nr:hypothetical protein [Pseudoalteromonas sp. S1609]TMP72727.1 hypothetical protein CWB76_01900 [Pseudoalteromonas sp. S1609]